MPERRQQPSAPPASAARHVIVGTAGHIDHGKTSLVRSLTGLETDRLPEEKARGISIDLGFAHFAAGGFQFGVVDVPGHERFIRNMVAGATGVDLALLVVAADDGVMPQTFEHLEIMDLLGIRRGVVAVSKVDLVDAEMVELVADEVRETVRGTFLEGCPVVPFSSRTGQGLDELRHALIAVAQASQADSRMPLFRMPIDRVFSRPGHGTVVTGTILGGQVQPGDHLEILPPGIPVRVRGVQNHGETAEISGSHQRTAVNLTGVKAENLERGLELAIPGYLRPATRLLVKLRCLTRSGIPLKDRQAVRLHMGTTETAARLVLREPIAPGNSGFGELRLRQPVVATWGQPFILRRLSPEITVAGGLVLDPSVPKSVRVSELSPLGPELADDDPSVRLSAWLRLRDDVAVSPLEAAWKVGVRPEELDSLIRQLAEARVLVPLGVRIRGDAAAWIHRDRASDLEAAILRRVRAALAKHQPRRSLPRRDLLAACDRLAEPRLTEALFDRLLQSNSLVKVGENIGPAEAQVKLSKNQALIRTRLLEAVGQGGLSPPTLKELAESLGQRLDEVAVVANVCLEDGLVVDLGEGLVFAPRSIERARSVARDTFGQHGGTVTISQLREAWQTTRKYALPLCQFFDTHQVTQRDGDLRRPGPRMDLPLFGPE